MINKESWEDVLAKNSLLPGIPLQKKEEEPPEIITWIRVYPGQNPAKKGEKRP